MEFPESLLTSAANADRNHLHRAYLAAIVESSFDAIISKDLNGIITSWNSGAETIFGWSAAEMIGSSIQRLIPPDRLEEESEILGRLRRGERLQILETRRLTKSGRVIDVSVTVSPIRGRAGEIIGASKSARDITEIREREREISRVANLYDALSHITQAIVRAVDRQSLLRSVCRALVERGRFGMVWVGWHDPQRQLLTPIAVYGDRDGYLRSIEVASDERPEGRGPTGSAFRTNRPYVCNDLSNDPNTGPWREEMKRRGLFASAAFPIRLSGQPCGTLSVYSDRVGHFKPREVALLEEAAADISFALENFEREAARLEAERRLRSEKLFSDTMIESMPGAVYFCDADGHFLRWNRNFEQVSGYSAAEIATMKNVDLFPPAEQPLLAARIADVFEQGEATVEANIRAKDGTLTPYFFTGLALTYEGRRCFVGMGIDVTERRLARQNLAASERKYRELIEHAHSIIMRWDTSGRVTFMNGFGLRFFGYAAEELVGRELVGSIMPAVETGGRNLGRLLSDILANPSAFEQSVSESVRTNGERVWVAWTNQVIEDHAGQVREMLSIGSDLSARRQAAAERERRERAEAADRLKSTFLATMSHELRTPLNSIIGFTDIVLEGMAGPLNAEQTKQLDMVRKSSRHLLALINDVLDISKIQAGGLTLNVEPFNLPQSMQRVIDLVTPQATAKGLELHARFSPQLGDMIGDQRRFEQILLNLLGNALKFTERGSVTLTADRTHELTPRAAQPGPCLRLRVTDTGIGIRSQDLPSLFQPFSQIDSGLSRTHEGTGLGLMICQRLAELMDGHVRAESVWGQGSTFTLTLPLREPA